MRPLIVAALFVAFTAAPAAARGPGREGRFGVGLGVEPLGIGLAEIIGPGGGAAGLFLEIGARIDLGPRLALRLPIEWCLGSGDDQDYYFDLAFVPGLVYRFRETHDQTWVPWVGAGIKLGIWQAGDALLDVPLFLKPTPRDWDPDDGDSDPELYTETGAFVGWDLSGGITLHPGRTTAIDFTFGLSYQPLDIDLDAGGSAQRSIFLLRQMISLRWTI